MPSKGCQHFGWALQRVVNTFGGPTGRQQPPYVSGQASSRHFGSVRWMAPGHAGLHIQSRLPIFVILNNLMQIPKSEMERQDFFLPNSFFVSYYANYTPRFKAGYSIEPSFVSSGLCVTSPCHMHWGQQWNLQPPPFPSPCTFLPHWGQGLRLS